MRKLIPAALAVLLLGGAAQADVLQQIADRGQIRLGVRADAAPFSYRREDGRPAGLAVVLCRRVAELIGAQMGLDRLDIEYVTVSAQERFPALIEGRTDLHCGPASATLKRRETLDFSLTYFVDGAAAAVRPGTFETVFQARSGTFGVLAGTTTRGVVEDLIRRNDLDVRIVEFPSHVRGLEALADENVDLYFGDQAILLFQIDAQALSDYLVVMEEVFSFEPYALVMRRRESEMRLAVDRALSQIFDEGEIYVMISEELGDFPLPPETRALYQIVGLP